jgi:hypothetical protein
MFATTVLFSLHSTSRQLNSQVSQEMFGVHVAGDELDALTHDFRQNRFAISVNRYNPDQLHDAFPHVPNVARFSPGQLELRRPLTDQITLQRPPLFIGQVGHSDPQHHAPSTARNKVRRLNSGRMKAVRPYPMEMRPSKKP